MADNTPIKCATCKKQVGQIKSSRPTKMRVFCSSKCAAVGREKAEQRKLDRESVREANREVVEKNKIARENLKAARAAAKKEKK